VLQAPPGAGKTTRVPLALLGEDWLSGARLVMLEPRRIAARAAAAHMARLLGEEVGETVGYRVRLDTRVGPRTRLEVVTEGVLTRMLLHDPALEGIGAVIFDEFHERSLQADVGLALALQCRDFLRPDLRLLVMSATLDGERVAEALGGAPIVTSVGRVYPVETRYPDRPSDLPLETRVARTVHEALEAERGDLLVFLPGVREIERTAERLQAGGLPAGTRVIRLHGQLDAREQDRAIAPSPPGERKVVLATAIAETSLTIEGVGVVVDAGLMRIPRFSPRTGMTRLETVTVSAASAEQRRGRAGRVGPGVCYRLWPAAEQGALVPHTRPEILDADLAPLALDLARWGVRDPGELTWLDPPPPAAYAQARELLRELGALEANGSPTELGSAMAGLPTHPRLARLLLAARERGLGGLGCELTALLGERDVFRRGAEPADPDLRLRVQALRDLRDRRPTPPHLDRGAAHRALQEARHWRSRLRIPASGPDSDVYEAAELVALAYPDRVALRRPGDAPRFLTRGGRGAMLERAGSLAAAPALAIAELGGHGRESRVLTAAPLATERLERLFADQVVEEREVAWDAEAGAVRARSRTRLGALVLREAPLRDPDPAEIEEALLGAIRESRLAILPWTDAALRTRERLAFLHHLDPGWRDVSDEALLATLDEWLRPYLGGVRRREQLAAVDLHEALLSTRPWEHRRALDELAPTHLTVPSGSSIAIDYGDPAAPVLAVRLQEVFGMRETPRVGGGRVQLTMHLLSPARRPVQVTRDLESFWRSGYFEVRKDLRGRYPKHHWPDDPLQAEPTRRTRPRPD
jgi:ATP-dependent helicase HrpB